MTDFFSKKMAVSILAMMTLSIFISHASLAKNPSNNFATTKAVTLPDLPLSNQAKDFAKKYPNTAKYAQADLYMANILVHRYHQMYYLDTGTNYSASRIHQLENCEINNYTADNLNALYKSLQSAVSDEQFAELEKVYGSPDGKKLLQARLDLAKKATHKNLTALGNNDNLKIMKDSGIYSPMLEAFFDSLPALAYRQGLETTDIRDVSQPTMQCIGKIIGRNLT